MSRKTPPARQSSSQAESASTITAAMASNIRRPSRIPGNSKPAALPEAALTKTQQVIGLLRRKTGVSIKELQEVTGWQAHSIRGLLSGALRNRHGLNITSDVHVNGTRRYRIEAGSK